MAKTVKFETAFQRLEEIARLLESGEVSLDDSLKLYEEGMELIDLCSKKLNTAEKKILKLSKSADETFHTEPLDDIDGD